jgi:hypothetical protein
MPPLPLLSLPPPPPPLQQQQPHQQQQSSSRRSSSLHAAAADEQSAATARGGQRGLLERTNTPNYKTKVLFSIKNWSNLQKVTDF